jgi:internalin A
LAAWFVSYAWRDDTSPAGLMREQQVDQACEAACGRGITILRDKDVLHPGDSIERFMRDIGAGDRIFVFLSDKYLKSPFCMFELHEVWRQSRQDAEVLRDRLRLWTLGDANIRTPEDRAD